MSRVKDRHDITIIIIPFDFWSKAIDTNSGFCSNKIILLSLVILGKHALTVFDFL